MRGRMDTMSPKVQLGHLVTSIYDRASGATHVEKQREEIAQILKYFHAVMFELLPSIGDQKEQ